MSSVVIVSAKQEVGISAERTLGSLLQQPYGYIQRSSYGKLAGMGYEGIRPAHSAIFRNLRKEGSSISELASRAGMTKQSMGYLVETLVTEGYLTVETDAKDARMKRILLSSRGREVTNSLIGLSKELEKKLEGRYGRKWILDLRKKLLQLEDCLMDKQIL